MAENLKLEKVKELETDLIDRMKNVKQWFWKVNSEKEKLDFIFDFIHQLSTKTDKNPRMILFFNQKNNLDTILSMIQADERFKDIKDQFAIYHGDMDMVSRKKAREDFDNGKFNYLLTTNLVARGIDFYEVTCVINCDIPVEITKRGRNSTEPLTADQIDVQTYIHRVGRAGRSNKKGLSITVSSIEGEDQIIKLAAGFDVTIKQYSDFEEIRAHLAECQIHNKGQNENPEIKFDKTWTQLGVSSEFQDHLIKIGFVSPKPSQAISVPNIINYKVKEDTFYSHISVFGFANGRGKTLCFLVPLIQKYKSQQKMTNLWQPQIIILAHTKDLCLQIGKVLSQMMPPTKQYEISYLYKDSHTKNIKGSICIGTPGYVVHMMKSIKTDKLMFLVVDEADEVLYNNTKDMKSILHSIYQNIASGFQFLLYSATFEGVDYENLEEIIDDSDFNQNQINVEQHFDI